MAEAGQKRRGTMAENGRKPDHLVSGDIAISGASPPCRTLLVKRLRETWPKVRIVLRADSGFCRWRMLSWCERHDVEYIVGIARNNRLNRFAERVLDRSEEVFWSPALQYAAPGTTGGESFNRNYQPMCVAASVGGQG